MTNAGPDHAADLKALLCATSGGRVLLPLEDFGTSARTTYARAMKEFDQYEFWRKGARKSYRKRGTLWLPQRRAVQFIQAYIASHKKQDQAREAALVKMPTGTGKTAVIAATACLSSLACKTLIITPRDALVRQMRRDLCFNFWRKLNAIYYDGQLHEGMDEDGINVALEDIRGRGAFPIRRLISDEYKRIWAERKQKRNIIVGTFNALHRVLGVPPPPHRSMYERSAQDPAASLLALEADTEADEHSSPTDGVIDFRNYLASVDLVIVDEGHYEPAYSWRQAIQQIGKPTVIFSATPYRNDYKYFEIDGRYVFNLSWQEAVKKKLIRDVKYEFPIGRSYASFHSDQARKTRRKSPRSFYSEARFVEDFAETFKALPAGKKVIVHASTFASLKRLQVSFLRKCNTAPVLIHDRFQGDEKKCRDLEGLSKANRDTLSALRFRFVWETEDNPEAEAAAVWLHQFKLLEGIDKDSFVEIWLYDAFGSARQVVQQIGRAVRRPDLTDSHGQTAFIRGSGMPLETYDGAPTVAQQLDRRWTEYLEYEKYAASSPELAFTAETQLLASVKRTAPAVQYIGGEFRGGHLLDQSPTMAAFQLPRRGIVCRVNGVEEHKPKAVRDEFLDGIQDAACEAMLLEERFDIVVVPPPEDRGYKDVRMIRYLAWNNSPYLISHHIPEWRLGVMVVVRAGRYLFLLDTEGVCIDTSRLGLLAPEPVELRRLFPSPASGRHPKRANAGDDGRLRTRIVETSSAGLDVSELGIRALTLRKPSLDESYFDLAEAAQVPTVIKGTGPLADETVRRRLSFARSSVADATNRLISVRDYVLWTRTVGDRLADESVEDHKFFARFARQVPPPGREAGAPRSILLDLWGILDIPTEVSQERRWDEARVRTLLNGDTCLDVREHYEDEDAEPRYYFDFEGFQLELKYVRRNTIPPTARYRIIDNDERLHSYLSNVGPDEGGRETDPDNRSFGRQLSASLIRYINQEQSFRVIPALDEVVYAQGHFYQPEISDAVLSMIEPCREIAHVISEKGDTRIAQVADFDDRTLFGKIYSWFDRVPRNASEIARDIHNCTYLICDDGNIETADFYGIDEQRRRVFIIHAKADDRIAKTSARKLQEIGRQAQTSLAFAGSVRESLTEPPAWRRDWSVRLKNAGGARIHRQRIMGQGDVTPGAAFERLNRALADPTTTTHIVMLTAGLLSADAARDAQRRRDQHDLQFLYYLAGLRTAFDRAGVRLRIVANA